MDIQRNLSAEKEQIDTIHSLADNCLDKQDFDSAEKYLMDALSATRNLLGDDNDTISSIYNSLGALYDYTGRYEESIDFAKKSIELDTNLYGKYNFNTAHSYHNIAGTYCNIGKLDEAQKAYEEAIEIKTQLFGKNHYETSISLAGLGNIFKFKKEYDKAIEYHTKYYESYKSTFGDNDPYLAVILAGIGTDFYEKGDFGKALHYHKEALGVLLASHEDVVSSYYNYIGNDLYCLDNYEEAIDAYQNGMRCKDVGDNPYTKSILLNCIARSYVCLGEYKKAKPYFEEALGICLALFNEDDSRVKQCQNNVDRINNLLSD